MHLPTSTYRIQLHAQYTFRDLLNDLPYIYALGIDAIYASPIFRATPGSTHGYDVTDMTRLNPELGTEKDFLALIDKVHEYGMYWIQDIVPNHMAFNLHNSYIEDVLRKGRSSPYARFFDVDWEHPDDDLNGRIMVPFLGGKLHEVIENQELELSFGKDGFVLAYYDNKYPLSYGSWHVIFREIWKQALPEPKEKVWKKLFELWKTHDDEDPEAFHDTFQNTIVKSEFLKPTARQICDHFNSYSSLMHVLLAEQHYRLSYWKETEQRINYRRFFTVNDLICVNVDDPEVFDATHTLVEKLYKDKKIHGVRIDHIDGLKHPRQYLDRLRKKLGKDAYIVVEKILSRDEKMDANWPVQGTTGYEFLGITNQLLINAENAKPINDNYEKVTGEKFDYHKMVVNKKRFMLRNRMKGELDNLWRALLHFRTDLDEKKYYEALTEVLAHMPVYRTYLDAQNTVFPAHLRAAMSGAQQSNPALEEAIVNLEGCFDIHNEAQQVFIEKFQQLSGPLAAKGVEDTTFYLYNRFIAQNEVGDEPDIFGLDNQQYFDALIQRQNAWPHTMNGTSSHDTKRGEDTRARLAALSELPADWTQFIDQIMDINFLYKPTPNDQMLIWQSIIGGWPMTGTPDKEFKSRLKAFIQKALREGKSKTSWTTPNQRYEDICAQYCDALLENFESTEIFEYLLHKTIPVGIVKSITQVILKLAAPGVADIYQGNELWNLSFVDPDNRRPVDYEKRKHYLEELIRVEKTNQLNRHFENIINVRHDERLKMLVTHRMLTYRKQNRDLFLNGNLIPLNSGNEHIAFTRQYENKWLYVHVPKSKYDLSLEHISNMANDMPEKWLHLLTGDTGSLQALSKITPFTVLKSI